MYVLNIPTACAQHNQCFLEVVAFTPRVCRELIVFVQISIKENPRIIMAASTPLGYSHYKADTFRRQQMEWLHIQYTPCVTQTLVGKMEVLCGDYLQTQKELLHYLLILCIKKMLVDIRSNRKPRFQVFSYSNWTSAVQNMTVFTVAAWLQNSNLFHHCDCYASGSSHAPSQAPDLSTNITWGKGQPPRHWSVSPPPLWSKAAKICRYSWSQSPALNRTLGLAETLL